MKIPWRRFWLRQRKRPAVVDPRRRMRIALATFCGLLLFVFAMIVRLELAQGEAFRNEATRPLRREKSIAGVRGRILSYDGQVLAGEKETLALAVHYRYLQDPPDPAWLRRRMRQRLTAAERRDPERRAAAEAALLDERRRQAARLAELSGVSLETWQRRAAAVQARVERIAESVNRRRDDRLAAQPQPDEPPPTGLRQQLARAIRDTLRATMDDPPPPRIVVAEEIDYHVLAEDVAPAAADEIESHPERYPGVRILRQSRRFYAMGPMAAHVLGHLGMIEAGELAESSQQASAREQYAVDDFVGRMGVERQYERLLRGRRGRRVEMTDHSGRALSSYDELDAAPGRDLVLTIDARLQQAAERLLDLAIQRRETLEGELRNAGGAIVVLDVETGAVRAAASAPRFDPNVFAFRQREGLEATLDHPARPLFDRAARMAIAPGSTFKTLTAIALVEARAIDPEEPYDCRGYLHRPDRQRCEIFVRHGKGHGEVTLYDALAQSCNVYFFEHAGRMGPERLLAWASRFGFGRPTGIDLPSEAAGLLPTPETIRAIEGHPWQVFDTQAMAIGQGSLTATPLQVAAMMAAVANGGRRVTPHVLSGLVMPPRGSPTAGEAVAEDTVRVAAPQPIAELRPRTLDVVRHGLEMVVSDPSGTAHGTVYVEELAIAGKTGTAETGGGRPSHAWFAGYAPADRPRVAFAIALEHGGSGAESAAPLAKRLALALRELGML